MQRMPQSNIPNMQGQRDTAPHMSPAYTMAARIRNEQGKERAGEYLDAMEPFLAPGERAHIAAQLGVPLTQTAPPPNPFPPPPVNQGQPFGQSFGQQMPPILSQFAQNRSGMNDPMQMIQMLSSLRGMNGGDNAGKAPEMNALNSTLLLTQLLGMMGKK